MISVRRAKVPKSGVNDENSVFIYLGLTTAPEKYRAWDDLDSLFFPTTVEGAHPYDVDGAIQIPPLADGS